MTYSDPQAETEVLRSAFIPEAEAVFARLDDDLIFTASNRVILAAIRELRSVGAPVNVLSLLQRLTDASQVEQAGGPCAISMMGDATTPASCAYQLDVLRELHAKRSAFEIFSSAATQIETGADVSDVTAQAQSRLDGVRAALAGSVRGLPPIRDLSAMLADPAPLPGEVISGILHRQCKLAMGGGSKTNKTWTLTDCAMSVATGADWLGFPTVQGRVMYVNLEVGEEFFIHRAEQIARARGLTVTPGMVRLWSLRGHVSTPEKIADAIIREARGQGFALVIVDPLYKVNAGRDENSAGDMGAVMREFDRITNETGAALGYASHFSKGNQSTKEAIDRISGSGVFARDADTILTFTAHEEPNAYTVDATLRNHAPVAPFVCRWSFPLMVADGALDPTKLKKAKTGREASFAESDVLQILRDSKGLSSADWQRECEEELGMSRRTFYDLKKRLNGSVFRSKTEGGIWLAK